MIRFAVLGSGSSGNAVWVGAGGTSVLFDAGFSCARLVERLDSRGIDPRRLDAIVVSHEHADHVSGLRVFQKRHPVPVHATAGTLAALDKAGIPVVAAAVLDGSVEVGDLTISAIPVPHDAVEPVGFLVSAGGVRLGIVTDLGCVTHLVRGMLAGCHALILEFNHDLEMLLNGPYHPDLKARIRGRHGHLSNDDAAELAGSVLHDDFQMLVLAHLSSKNNLPRLALRAARAAVPKGIEVVTAAQDVPWGPVTIG